ncbi:MAG: hypothetical protein HYZ84_05580 [Candidatus Omnitrophica bacterium]|nr:hypothetical protein [Candidatus Omnitrophota bacterium]
MTRINEAQEIKNLQKNAEKALKKAVAKAIRQHELAGVPAVIWKNGKVVRVSAKSIFHEPSAKYGRRKKK